MKVQNKILNSDDRNDSDKLSDYDKEPLYDNNAKINMKNKKKVDKEK